ncbi:hypothetical protein HQQ81_15750 [Microbacteriaceae bacterium VKM Ac-2854]|nr:hypothetical protein [Microbacteriaceae bacterium VKM Ac-2854]
MAARIRVELGAGHWTAIRGGLFSAELTDGDIPDPAWRAFAADVAVLLSTGFVSRSEPVARMLDERCWDVLRLARAEAIAGRPGPTDASAPARTLHALERFAFGAAGAARLLRWPATLPSRLDLAYALHEDELAELAEPVRGRLLRDIRVWSMIVGSGDATAELGQRLRRVGRHSTDRVPSASAQNS